jgi:hypothetical protein
VGRKTEADLMQGLKRNKPKKKQILMERSGFCFAPCNYLFALSSA